MLPIFDKYYEEDKYKEFTSSTQKTMKWIENCIFENYGRVPNEFNESLFRLAFNLDVQNYYKNKITEFIKSEHQDGKDKSKEISTLYSRYSLCGTTISMLERAFGLNTLSKKRIDAHQSKLFENDDTDDYIENLVN